MARISYDERTAEAFKAVREVPRDGLLEWREAVRRHLRPFAGDDSGGHRRGDRCVRGCFLRLVRPERPRSRAVGRDAGPDSADGRRSRCSRETRAPFPCRMTRQTPPGSPLSSTTSLTWKPPRRDPPRSPTRRPGPHPSGLSGQVRPGRARPLVPRDRPGCRDLPLRRGYVRGVRSRGIPPGGSRAGSRDVPGQPRGLPRAGGHLPSGRHDDAEPHRGRVPPRQRTSPQCRATGRGRRALRRPEATGLTSWFCAERG